MRGISRLLPFGSLMAALSLTHQRLPQESIVSQSTFEQKNAKINRLMPPSAPLAAGIPRIALVLARLIVEGEDRGTRQFIVPVNDGRQMYRGIKAWLVPVKCTKYLV